MSKTVQLKELRITVVGTKPSRLLGLTDTTLRVELIDAQGDILDRSIEEVIAGNGVLTLVLPP